jgi:hypothetical protein
VTLIESAPTALAVCHFADLKEYISRLVGVRLQPTPIQDQSSLSLLFYDRPGGHIGERRRFHGSLLRLDPAGG